MEKIVFGSDVLDKMFGKALTTPLTIVIAGHPGAGKTTLSSSICYANTLNNSRCLYISFQEDKEGLFRNMKNVGLDLEYAEKKGMLLFLKFPVVLDIDSVIDEISKAIANFNPSVIVIDSINVLLSSVEKDDVKRAWLQNYFYELAKQIKGIVVLVAELPFGAEQLSLGSIEFVVDAIFILKHRVEDGRLVRVMEIRKMRGAPITLAEIPFAITPRSGLKVYIPPILEEIPAEGDAIKHPCGILHTALGEVQKGHVALVSYPAIARPPEIFLLLFGYALVNKARVLVISFRSSPQTMKSTIIKSLETFGISEKSVVKYIEENFVFKSFNPFALSSTELVAQLIEVIDNVNPDIVILHAFDIFAIAYKPRHFSLVYNIINYTKSKSIFTAIMTIKADKGVYSMFTRLSDIVLDFRYRYRNRLCKMVHIWRRERDPYIASDRELMACRDEIYRLVPLS